MSKVKAIIIGVSNYDINGATNLEFCKNDILAIEKALVNGLKLSKQNISILGSSGEVKKEDFENILSTFIKQIDDTDTILLYFSGHGGIIDNQHVLAFTDGYLHTQKIIEKFEKSKAKSKIILLDCCHAGLFTVDETFTFNTLEAIKKFNGKGCAVLASSGASEVSRCHPKTPISLFTAFLCDAFQNELLIKDGCLSLNDIQNTVSMRLKIWNKENKNLQQQPIFRSNVGGTIYFHIKEYAPYQIKKIYQEHKNYIIFNVSSSHHGLAKRYSVQVILKKPCSSIEVIELSKDIKKIVSKVEVHNNKISEKKWSNKIANIIWIHFGYSETDLLNSNFKFFTTWVDDKQDKKHWYAINSKDQFVKDEIHFRVNSNYELFKEIYSTNMPTEEELKSEIIKIVSKIIILAESVIRLFYEFINKTINEDELFEKMEPINIQITKQYDLSGNLSSTPNELKELRQICEELFCIIHNFTFFYNKKYKLERTYKNRIDCMNMTIKDYHLTLNKFNTI